MTSALSSAQAASFNVGALISPIIEYAWLKSQLEYLDGAGSDQVFRSAYSRYGRIRDPQAERVLDSASKNVLQQFGASDRYRFWVNPSRSFNAACFLGRNITVNQGAFKMMHYNEDIMAFVIAHEITHAQKKHIISRYDSYLPMTLVRSLYMSRNNNNTSDILSAVVVGQYAAYGVSVPHEWEADNLGAEMAIKAGYNPAGGAILWSRVQQRYGERHRSFVTGLFYPPSHPTSSQRIAKMEKRMEEMSGGRISISGGRVNVDGAPLSCSASVKWSSKDKAYWTAGEMIKSGNYEMPEECSEPGGR